MSVPVELPALRSRIDEYGTTAFLVTVGPEGGAHVVSVTVRVDGDRLVVPTGRTTRANLERNPGATLLWPPRPDPAYSLIVDATAVVATEEADGAVLEPRSAILHRVAGAAGDGPTCVPVTEEHAGT
jgi:hypothetical protein